VKRPFPYIGETPGLIDGVHIEQMGKARGLFSFFVTKQTDPAGWVNYGHVITYDWIRSRIPNCQPRRTLQRWMAQLKAGRYLEVEYVPYGGMVVRILRAKKWASQLSLDFGQPVEQLVQKASKSCWESVDARRSQCATSGALQCATSGALLPYRKESFKKKPLARISFACSDSSAPVEKSEEKALLRKKNRR
jgi:hypothetical protein